MFARKAFITLVSIWLLFVFLNLATMHYGYFVSYTTFKVVRGDTNYSLTKIHAISRGHNQLTHGNTATLMDINSSMLDIDHLRTPSSERRIFLNLSTNKSLQVRANAITFNPKEDVSADFLENASNHGMGHLRNFSSVSKNYNASGKVNSEPVNKMTSGLARKQLHNLEPKHQRETVRDTTCNGCFAHNFKYTINNEHVCYESVNQTIDLIVMILTAAGNFEARNALRQTWLSLSKGNTANIRYVFLLGNNKNATLHERVEEENAKYKDIIKEDFMDTYMNLTYKTVMGYKWIASYCPNAKYVMKTDDDMFINIPNVLRYIRSKGNTLDNNLAGSCHVGAPNRNRKSKWFAPTSSYRENRYPGFCSGTAYITGMKVATKIYNISSSIPFFHLEDVYIGLCLRKVGGNIINLQGFNRARPPLNACLYKGDNFYSAHRMSPVMLFTIWKSICKTLRNNQKA